MTKNNFIALAAALRAVKPNPFQTARYEQWTADVCAIIDVCAKMNPRFNRGRFMAACDVPNILDGSHAEDRLKWNIINYHQTNASDDNGDV